MCKILISSCVYCFRALIGFVSENQPLWRGYMYALLLFIIAEVQTLLLTHSLKIIYEMGLRFRTALISVIYKKVGIL